MKRGDRPISREQAIEFCKERYQMHLLGSEHWKDNYRSSGDNIDMVRSESQKDLALIYGDIADLLTASD